MSEQHRRFVVGAMTGTSLDGIDAALLQIEGDALAIQATLVASTSQPLGGLAADLRPLAEQTPAAASEFTRLAAALGAMHADVIADLLAQSSTSNALDLVAVHGQTILHAPPLSWQLIDPTPIARRVNCPVVFDLRAADLAAGGQGAPITPLADWVLLRDAHRRRAIVNLGGFANATILPLDEGDHEAINQIDGFDICACNQLLDAIAQRALGEQYDVDGQAAMAGDIEPMLMKSLSMILTAQAADGRSLGTRDDAAAWIDDLDIKSARPADLAATATHAIASTIGRRLDDANVDEVILAGGGTHNRALVRSLRDQLSAAVTLADDHGVPVQMREAMAMAVLGTLCADGVPITLPRVTGCAHPPPVAGAWVYPPTRPPD